MKSPYVPELLGRGLLLDGRPWIAMERIEGDNLADLVADRKLAVGEAIAIGIAILTALDHIHAAGFAHRDLKPDNIYLRADRSAVILDLGLARRIPDDPDDPTAAHVQVGSLEYIPPEQLVDASGPKQITARADLYAFGCVLYELLAGRPPFIGDAATLERAHAALRPSPIGALVAVPPAVEALCHDLLAKEPDRRPANAQVAIARLRESVSERSLSAGSSGRSLSVISEGAQPVVLIWTELPKIDRTILARLGARKITIVSQRGRRVIGALLGLEHGDPATAAIAAARDLAALGARVALHLGSARVTPGPSGLVPSGPVIEQPETWVPAGAWTGVVLTRAFAAIAQTATRPLVIDGVELRTLAEGDAVQLVGREALLGDLATDAAATLATVAGRRALGPAFAIITGEAGVGKTCVAKELAARLGPLGRVHFMTIPPPGSAPAHGPFIPLLDTSTPTANLVRSIGDALRAAARVAPTAIVIDDLHLADHDVLDALEYATLGGEALPLWIGGFASDRLDDRRPNLGGRAERHRRAVLAPLDDDAAVALTTKLLEPAQYPPLRALRKLASLARGNPLHLTMLAREVHERGAIRRRDNGEHFLDTTALDALPPIALGPWLAARELASASPELVALARLCAVLGGELARDEVHGVVELVERGGGASTPIDVDIGLRELASLRILVPQGPNYRFRQALLEDGVYATTAIDDRVTIHRAALAYWTAHGDVEHRLGRIAKHAQAAHELDTAAAAFVALGESAARAHQLFDADQSWERAVQNLPSPDVRRAHALLGRARARQHLQRLGDSLADLDAALAIADALADQPLAANILLERAITLDHKEAFDEAAATTVAARTRVERPDPDLALRFALAEGRDLFREGKLAETAAIMRDVIAKAPQDDVRTVAELLLGPTLVDLGEVDEAAAVFARLVERCERAGDRFHLAATYVNRAWLSFARGDVDATATDLRLVIQIARESGQANLERGATHNLAENYLFQGSLDDALLLAERSFAIVRAHEGAAWPDQLLIARIHAARDDRAALAPLIATLAETAPAATHPVLAVLRLVVEDAPAERWAQELASAAEVVTLDTRCELSRLALDRQKISDDERIVVGRLAESHPIWSRRFSP